jgi:hypothetical protein
VESVHAVKDLGVPTGSVAALLFLVVLLAPQLYSAFERAARFIDDPASEAARGSIAEVRAQLGRLIGPALYNRRLVVFVDDLERCTPERAMEVCEVANQLLSHHNVVTVFIADMHMIAKTAEERFRDASSGGNAGRRYLEKIVQLQLTLPPPKTADLEHLLEGGDPGDGGRTPLSPSEADDERGHSPSAPFGTPSDVPFLIAQNPLIGVPAFVLGAIVGCRAAFSAGAIRPGAADPHTATELLLGIPAGASGSTILAACAFAFEGATLDLHDSRHAASGSPTETEPLRAGRDKQLFDGDPRLTPAHLGAWIVLSERWPSIARRVERDPQCLGRLQALAQSGETLALAVGEEGEGQIEELAKLLTKDSGLGTIASRLVHFE